MRVAAALSTVFTPELFVLLSTLLLVGYERRRDLAWKPLTARVGVVGAAWVVAFAVYRGGLSLVGTGVPGGDDFFAALALVLAFAGIGAVWRRRRWGPLVAPYAALLIGTSLLHLVVVPLWNTSSHVIYAAVPAGALTGIDRRFAPLLAVAPLLVWSRIATGAHSVDEALGGLLVAGVVLAGAFVVRRRG
ncbi:hypothetical protein JCM30237_12810 [Halolamina litorea]|uniref:PAP2 superfamily protein n=1 Tax=Halolamina litorea TaxID=1515593 RepID=A0ABD6BPG2_9EURY|nr:hypothetical protein [Halolamina litorea]